MRSQYGKTAISLLFLSVFLLLRVADVHALSHFADHADEVHCELCDIITVSQETTPFLEAGQDNPQSYTPVFLKSDKVNSAYNEPLYHIVSPLSVYNKPPPSPKI